MCIFNHMILLMSYVNFFFFLRILSIFDTHTGRKEKVLKKLIVVYIQKGLSYVTYLNIYIYSLINHLVMS